MAAAIPKTKRRSGRGHSDDNGIVAGKHKLDEENHGKHRRIELQG